MPTTACRHRWLHGLADDAVTDKLDANALHSNTTKARRMWKLLSTNEFQAARALVDTVHTLETAKCIMMTLDA